VTVVVPTRDRPALLEAALRSVVLQTHPVDQILVVDDGSREPVSSGALGRISPSIELIRRETSRGVSAARNAGLDRARGDVVVFLDDDDLIHPRLVEEALTVLEAQPAAGAVVFLYKSFSDENPLGESETQADALPSLPEGIAAGSTPFVAPRITDNPVPRGTLEARPVSAFLRYLIPVQSCVIRRKAIGDLRFPETLRQGEDTHFWIAVAAAGCRFAFDPRIRAYVRRHEGNVTRSRARYVREIQACYSTLLADSLLTAPDDVFLAHLKLAWFQVSTGRGGWRHLFHVVLSPRHLASETAFWLANLLRRGRSLSRRSAP